MTLGAGMFSGKPVRRVEDLNLLRGAGTYVDNVKIEGMLTLYFVRSPIAHATIRSVDVKAAREMPGVVGVYSADDFELPFRTLHNDAASSRRPALTGEGNRQFRRRPCGGRGG